MMINVEVKGPYLVLTCAGRCAVAWWVHEREPIMESVRNIIEHQCGDDHDASGVGGPPPAGQGMGTGPPPGAARQRAGQRRGLHPGATRGVHG